MAIEQVAHKSEVLAVIDPSVAQVHLYPGVEDFGRREGIDEFRNDASLKRLVDCEPVQSAANSHATQQGHEERALGVALPVAICEDLGRRNVVGAVVAEGNLVPDEIVDGPNSVVAGKVCPAALLDQFCN